MNTRYLMDSLEKFCPTEYASDWDNVGLLVGRVPEEIERVLLTVDVDEETIDRAIEYKAQMIIAHHPLIYRGIKRITYDTSVGRRILKLMEHGIGCYCMHTNFDVFGGMSTLAAQKIGLSQMNILEPVTSEEGIGRYGQLEAPITIAELCERVKKEFGLKHVVLYGDENAVVDQVAICPGSGKDMIGLLGPKGVQVFVTGDITYHYGIDAVADGLHIIDAGHYGLESVFMELMENYLLEQKFPIEIIRMAIKNPQKYI